MLFQNKIFCFSEPVYQAPACNDPFNDCGERLLKDIVAKKGTTRNMDREAHTDATISLTLHANYLHATMSHEKSRAATSTT